MAVILGSGVTEAGSTDIIISAGSRATVFLSDAAGPMVDPASQAEVQIKSAGGEYFKVGVLNSENAFIQAITAPGTYRVLRRAAAVAFAVEQV